MKITIPMPASWEHDGKHYAIEFDSDNIKSVNTERYLVDDGAGGKTFQGGNELKLVFDSLEVAPKWVELP